jgi:hypothetical protein
MPSTLTFWRFPDEEERLLTYLDKTGDIVACIDLWFADPALLEPRPLREVLAADNPQNVLMGPREFMDMADITTSDHTGEIQYTRSYMHVPLLAYSRGVWRGPRALGRTNLCFESTRSIPDASSPYGKEWIPQPPAFLAWARRVMQWVRRDTRPHEYRRQRVTARVAAEVEDGLQLVP